MQVNPSTVDWSLIPTISSSQFTGPSGLNAGALSTSCYPLTFCPQIEGIIEVLGALVGVFFLPKQPYIPSRSRQALLQC